MDCEPHEILYVAATFKVHIELAINNCLFCGIEVATLAEMSLKNDKYRKCMSFAVICTVEGEMLTERIRGLGIPPGINVLQGITAD